jgi:hypothetical protein
MTDRSGDESRRKPVRTDKRHVDCGDRLYRVGSDRILFCQNCQQQVLVGETPPHGPFHIDAAPTEDGHYNRIHTECETVATAILMEHNPVGQKIVGIFRMYRDMVEDALSEADEEVTDDQFISWLQATAEQRGTVGGWEDDAFEALDELFIQNIEDTDPSPREVFDYFDRYVDETTKEFEQVHDMEGFFADVE